MLKLLDVLISLCLIYFLFSVATSAVTEMFETWAKKRAEMLRQGVLQMLGDSGANVASKESDNATATTPMPLHEAVMSHHLIVSANRGFALGASYLPAATFSHALIDSLLSKKPASQWSSEASFKALREVIEQLDGHFAPLASLKQALLGLLNECDQTVVGFRTNVERWFNNQMDRVSGWYKRWTQWVSLGAGLLLAISLNVDSLQLTSSLWQNAALREKTSSIAHVVAANGDAKSKDKNDDPLGVLFQTELPIGWKVDLPKEVNCKTKGLPSQYAACIPTSCNLETVFWWLSKLAGWLLTALTVLVGSHFWFELMSTFINVRSGGVKPAANTNAGRKKAAK